MHRLLRYLIMGITIFIVSPILSQTRVEYFWDTDPGVGKATLLKSSNEETIMLNQNIPTNSLQKGIHQLVIRAVNANVGQPYYVTRPVLVSEEKTESVKEVEYYWDNDPGIGKGKKLNVLENDGTIMISQDLDCSSLSNGMHTIGIRARSRSGWSCTYVSQYCISNLPSQNVDYIEYFWDTDPGLGMGIAIPFTSSDNVVLNTTLSCLGLSDGSHQLNIRARSGNAWSTVYSTTVLIETIESNEVNLLEYFWDEDPGVGKGTVIAMPEGQQGNPFAIDLNTSDLSGGVHKLGLRAKAGKNWSQTEIRAFLIDTEGLVTRLEYFWDDEDPGIGNAIPLDVKPAHEIKITDLVLPLTGLSYEYHTLNIRAMSESEIWTETQRIPVKNVNPEGEYSIEVTYNEGGSVSASAKRVDEGKPVTFTFTPDVGHELYKATVNGNDIMPFVENGKYTINGVTDDIKLNAEFSLIHYHIITSCTAGGSVSASSYEVLYGEDVTFTVTTSEGYEIESIKLNGLDVTSNFNNGSYTLKGVTADQELFATFKPVIYPVHISCGSHGTVTADSDSIAYGQSISFTITPDEGYMIEEVLYNGNDVTNKVKDGKYSVPNVQGEVYLSVTFKIAEFNISVVCGEGGNVTSSAQFVNYGESVTFTITPDEGREIESVILNGVDITNQVIDGQYTVYDIKDHIVLTVTFGYGDIAMVISCSEGCQIQVNDVMLGSGELSTLIPYGSDVTIRLFPDQGYDIAFVTINGADVTSKFENNVFVIQNVTEQKNINVVATRTSYQIEVIESEGGTIIASSNTVIPGGSVTFTLLPDEGYEVVNVIMNGENITDKFENGTYTIETVRTDISIQATFAAKHYTITCSYNEGGMVMSSVPEVTHGGDATILIIPNESYTLASLTVNGIEMINEVINNVLKLKNIHENVVVIATFEYSDAINSAYARATTVKEVKYGIEVNNAPIGKLLNVYTMSGIPVKSIKILEENFFVNLPMNRAYIIKIDDRTFKIAL